MARKFEDEVTVIRIFRPDQDKMLEALKYVLNMKCPNEDKNYNKLSTVQAALIKMKINTRHSNNLEGLG